jgi:4-amino-4-deoxy-L-arabinose transferase-like glycosyltransferase
LQPIEQLRARRRLIVWIALAAAIGAGCALRLVHFDDVASRSPDERVYTEFARRLADQGLAAMPRVFAEYERNPDQWNYPSPTRIGHLVFVAAAMRISDVKDERAGAGVSLAFSCMSLFLVAWIGVRFFNPWVALAAVAFLASSVGELGMARRAWQDSAFGFFGLLVVYVTCEIVRSPRRVWLYPAFLAAGALSLLTKQTGVISYGVCGLWLVGYLIFRLRWCRAAIWLTLGGVASIGATVGIWGFLAGSVTVALSALNHSLHPGIPGLSYLQACCTGPWYQFFYLLWILGPLPAVLALIGIPVSLFPQRLLQPIGGAGTMSYPNCAPVAAWMTIGFFTFASVFPGMQCLRYISPADGTFALLAGIGLWCLLSLARRAMSRADYRLLIVLVAVGVVIEGARDYRTFTSVVVDSGMRDLSVADIRSVMDR